MPLTIKKKWRYNNMTDFIQDSNIPDIPDSGAIPEIPNQKPDAQVDKWFESLSPELFADKESPEQEEPVKDEALEVSEVSEQEPSDDDDSNIETAETEESQEDTAQETDLPVVDYDEAKNFVFSISGKEWTIDQISSALGRQGSQEQARLEIETRTKELDSQAEQLKAQEAAVQQQMDTYRNSRELAEYAVEYDKLTAAKDKFMQEGHRDKAYDVDYHLSKLNEKANAVLKELDAAKQQQASAAVSRLKDLGYGDIATDSQRTKAFVEYAKEQIPTHLVDTVNENAELLVILEKARLYDKAKSTVPQSKLKGATKTLKGGAAKPAAKPVKKDKISSKIDKMFGL